MSRKTYRLPGRFYLECGPDPYHALRIGPVRWDEMLYAFRRSPEELEAEHHMLDDPWGERIADALHEYAISRGEEDDAFTSLAGMRWLGASGHARVDGITVEVAFGEQIGADAQGVFNLHLDHAILETEARAIGRRALEELGKLVRVEAADGDA